MYTLYMVILFQLPSVRYYPDTVGMSLVQLQVIVGKILLSALLEIVSFIMLHLRSSGSSGSRHLSCWRSCLRTSFSSFVVWYLYVHELTLYHFGTSALASISIVVLHAQ